MRVSAPWFIASALPLCSLEPADPTLRKAATKEQLRAAPAFTSS